MCGSKGWTQVVLDKEVRPGGARGQGWWRVALYWAATLCWEVSFICLTQSLCISRMLWAKKGPGERGTTRKWAGSKNKHRGRANLESDDPGVQRYQHSLSVSLLCYPQTQLHSEGASYGHTTAAKIHVSLTVTNGRSWLPGVLIKEQESFLSQSPGKPLFCFTGPTYLRFVHSWTNYCKEFGILLLV